MTYLIYLSDAAHTKVTVEAEDFEHELFFGSSEPYDADRDER